MTRRRKWFVLSLIVAVVAIDAGAGYFIWLINSQSKARAQWGHGIALPASATAFQCRGDANRMFLDRGASTVFEMPETEWAALRARLPVNPTRETFVPGNAKYQDFVLPWGAAPPIDVVGCDSPTGDWLHVEVHQIAAGRVGVWMYTDWN